MAQRNLTADFKTLRDGFQSRRRVRNRFQRSNPPSSSFARDEFTNDETSPLRTEGFSSRLGTLPPVWVEAFEEVKRLTKEIKEKGKKLNELHKNRLLVSFDTRIEEQQEKEIQFVTNSITDLFRKAEGRLKHFDSARDGSTEKLIKNNLKRQLAQELQQLSLEFRKSQKEYLAHLSSQKGENNALDDLLGLNKPSDLDFDLEEGMLLSGSEKAFENEKLRQVKERDQEINKLAENINELAVIFKDLAALVIDQGTILDRIDYNLENVQIKTEKGLNELVQADKYSKNSRPFKCIMILVGIIIIEALFLIFKHS